LAGAAAHAATASATAVTSCFDTRRRRKRGIVAFMLSRSGSRRGGGGIRSTRSASPRAWRSPPAPGCGEPASRHPRGARPPVLPMVAYGRGPRDVLDRRLPPRDARAAFRVARPKGRQQSEQPAATLAFRMLVDALRPFQVTGRLGRLGRAGLPDALDELDPV